MKLTEGFDLFFPLLSVLRHSQWWVYGECFSVAKMTDLEGAVLCCISTNIMLYHHHSILDSKLLEEFWKKSPFDYCAAFMTEKIFMLQTTNVKGKPRRSRNNF